MDTCQATLLDADYQDCGQLATVRFSYRVPQVRYNPDGTQSLDEMGYPNWDWVRETHDVCPMHDTQGMRDAFEDYNQVEILPLNR